MNALTVVNTTIRQDSEGRYCLNDLHAAAGGVGHHRPSKWLATKQAQGLILALETRGDPSPNSGLGKAGIPALVDPVKIEKPASGAPATFVAKQLVYAYAMWISPEFNLRVIDAYDSLVTGEYIQPNIQHENYWFSKRPHWPAIRARVLVGERYRDIAAALGFTVGRVVRAVRSMIAVGLLAPGKVALVQRGPAKRSALMQATGWGQQQVQPSLPGF